MNLRLGPTRTKDQVGFPAMKSLRSHEWWAAKALEFNGQSCPKCNSMTRGEYIAGHDRLGECAVVQACLICGWEKCHIAGRNRRPY